MTRIGPRRSRLHPCNPVIRVIRDSDSCLNSGCDPFPRPSSAVGSTLARIVLKRRLELIWFCQLHLIAATLTRTIVALIAGDEREQGSLKPVLSYLVRKGKGHNKGPTICPIWIELEVPVSGRASTMPDSAQILNRDTRCRRGGDGGRRRWNWRGGRRRWRRWNRRGGWRQWRRWLWCCCGRNTPNHKTDNACSYPND
jgi:hypothetical protein